MRIWILNHYAVDPGQPSGTRHFDMARELVRRGDEVTIFAARPHEKGGSPYRGILRPATAELVEGVRFVRLWTTPYRGNGASRIVNMLSYFVAVLFAHVAYPRPHVVMGSSVHPLAGLAAFILSRVRSARFAYELRDLWPQVLIEMGAIRRGSIQANLLFALERFLLRRAEAVIVLWPAAARYVAAAGAKPDRISVIPNGAAVGAFSTTAAPARAVDGLTAAFRSMGPGRVVAMYIGAHGEANNLEVVIDAMRVLSDRSERQVQLVLVGDGPSKEALRRRADGLQTVLFLDQVPKAAVHELLMASDFAVAALRDTPLYRSGSSLNKLFDYFAASRPVVMSGNPDFNLVMAAGAGVCVGFDDARALAEAMTGMARLTPSERRAMGDAGRNYVVKHHNVSDLSDQLRGALAGRRPARGSE